MTTAAQHSRPSTASDQEQSSATSHATGETAAAAESQDATMHVAESDDQGLFQEAMAFKGVQAISLVLNKTRGAEEEGEEVTRAMEIVLEDGVLLTVELDSGEKRLVELGYTQTLERNLSFSELYLASITCIGLFIGIVPYYGTAFSNGGPVAVVWYWWIPAIFGNLMTLSIAEMVSSIPLAACMYLHAAILAPPKWRRFITFTTAWLEIVGMTVGTGGTVLAGVQTLNSLFLLGHSKFQEATPATVLAPASAAIWVPGFQLSPAQQYGICVGVVVVVGAMNFARVKTLSRVLAFVAVYQLLVALALIICLPVVAPALQSPSFVFTNYLDNWVGTTPSAVPLCLIVDAAQGYAFILALLLPQYSLYSMDSASHYAEEAKRSDFMIPLAMLASFGTVTLLAWAILVVMTFCIQDVASLSDFNSVTGGTQYFIQILWDAFFARFQSGTGAVVFVSLMYVALFFCSVAQIMTVARVVYALARDGGFPFATYFAKVDSNKVPTAAVFLTCAIAIISLTPVLLTFTAYYAITSMATIAWFLGYLFPSGLRIMVPESEFTPGPFHLATFVGVRGGKAIHSLSFLYALYTIASFVIPSTFPIDAGNFNYAPVALAIVVSLLGMWWVLDAHKWFRGPQCGQGQFTHSHGEELESHTSENFEVKHHSNEEGGDVEWY